MFGLETQHVSAHFGQRRANGTRHRQRAWLEVTVVLHTHSHLMLDAVPRTGTSRDLPNFTLAMRQVVDLVAVDTVLDDAGYDAEYNYLFRKEWASGRR